MLDKVAFPDKGGTHVEPSIQSVTRRQIKRVVVPAGVLQGSN